MTDTKRVKIAFWLVDMDTDERLCDVDGIDTWQTVMEFRGSDYDEQVAYARSKFPDLDEEGISQIAAPIHLGWSDEIIRAGFLTVAKAAQNLVLKHLGLPSADEFLKTIYKKPFDFAALQRLRKSGE